MEDLTAIESIHLPDSDGNSVRLGDLWANEAVVGAWLRHYG